MSESKMKITVINGTEKRGVTYRMKAMLDHFGYRWMPHRPAKEMFGKRAVIITQCLGAGGRSTAKDIKDSLSWWGISDIKVVSFKLMSEIDWDKIEDKRKASFQKKLSSVARKMQAINYDKPAHTNVMVKNICTWHQFLGKEILIDEK